MKVNRIFENYDERLKSLEQYRKTIIADLEIAKKNTYKFLEECEKVGIKIVSVGTKTDKIKSSEKWGNFGHEGSIFADERINEWPAI